MESFHLPIELHGTPFQISVYELLREIPYGTTLTYHALATRFGNKNAIRAVAAANARNPLPILIPCHRVIGVDGKLIGYLGGISAKKYLLLLENKYQLF